MGGVEGGPFAGVAVVALQKWEAEARRAKARYQEQMKEYQRTGKVSGETSSKKSSVKSPAKR